MLDALRLISTMCQDREAKFKIDALNRIDQIINRANENRNTKG